MAEVQWWQTMLSTAAGGTLAFAGQWVTSRRQAKTQEKVRGDNRVEAVYDRRLTYELDRLEELRQALLEADDVAAHGRRLQTKRLAQSSPYFATHALAVLTEGIAGVEPLDEERGHRFGPAMLALRGAIAVTLDDEVRASAERAFGYLNSGKKDGGQPVGEALALLGDRLRKIQGKV